MPMILAERLTRIGTALLRAASASGEEAMALTIGLADELDLA